MKKKGGVNFCLQPSPQLDRAPRAVSAAARPPDCRARGAFAHSPRRVPRAPHGFAGAMRGGGCFRGTQWRMVVERREARPVAGGVGGGDYARGGLMTAHVSQCGAPHALLETLAPVARSSRRAFVASFWKAWPCAPSVTEEFVLAPVRPIASLPLGSPPEASVPNALMPKEWRPAAAATVAVRPLCALPRFRSWHRQSRPRMIRMHNLPTCQHPPPVQASPRTLRPACCHRDYHRYCRRRIASLTTLPWLTLTAQWRHGPGALPAQHRTRCVAATSLARFAQACCQNFAARPPGPRPHSPCFRRYKNGRSKQEDFCGGVWAHDPLKSTRGKTKTNAGLIILRVASLGRDAQNESNGAGAAQLRAPSEQQLRHSSSSASQQHYNLQPSTQMVVLSSRPSSRCCWQHLEEGRGGTSRRDTTRELRAASAPSQQHQLRRRLAGRRNFRSRRRHTAVSCDDERSTGALLLKLFCDHSKCHSSSFSSK